MDHAAAVCRFSGHPDVCIVPGVFLGSQMFVFRDFGFFSAPMAWHLSGLNSRLKTMDTVTRRIPWFFNRLL